MQNSLTKKLGLTVATIAMAATSMFTSTDAEAVPAFARQTGMTCNSCHFQAFPALNGMGRSFRQGGYTMKGTQTSIEGENMDLPSAMNWAIYWKGYNVTGGVQDEDYATPGAAKTHGEIAWEDEIVMFTAGRVAPTVGYLFELGLNGAAGDHDGSGDEAGFTLFNNAKIHFNVATTDAVNVAVIPWSTDAAGPNFAMELMNVGGQKSQRVSEHKMTPGYYLGFYSTEATGLAFNFADPSGAWNLTLNKWAPVHNGAGAFANLGALATAYRASYFLDVAGFDTGIAYGSTSGTIAASSDGTEDDMKVAVAGSTFDFQMQGQVAGGDLGFYLSQGTAGDSDELADDITSNNGYIAGGGSGLGYMFKYSVMPKVQLQYGSTAYTKGTADYTQSVVGLDYMLAQNVRLTFLSRAHTDSAISTNDASETWMGWNIGF